MTEPFIVTEPEQSLAAREGLITPAAASVQTQPEDDLPAIHNAAQLLADTTIKLPPQLITEVLHKGLKGILGSSSKARKTWILLDMALSISAGEKFWNWPTKQGRVLVVNFEIPLPFLRERVDVLVKKKGIKDASNLDLWTLRGHSAPFSSLIPKMVKKIGNTQYDLIIVDPIYKGLAGQDENKAGDISTLCNELESFAYQTGAAVVYAHHFSKGNQANKETIDRFSGSGVFARDADTIIALTPHSKENCYTVDLVLRNFKEHDPFVVEWKYPIMEVRSDLDPAELKGRGGRPAQDHTEDLLELLEGKKMTTTQFEKAAKEIGVSRAEFYRDFKLLKDQNRIIQPKDSKKWEISK